MLYQLPSEEIIQIACCILLPLYRECLFRSKDVTRG